MGPRLPQRVGVLGGWSLGVVSSIFGAPMENIEASGRGVATFSGVFGGGGRPVFERTAARQRWDSRRSEGP